MRNTLQGIARDQKRQKVGQQRFRSRQRCCAPRGNRIGRRQPRRGASPRNRGRPYGTHWATEAFHRRSTRARQHGGGPAVRTVSTGHSGTWFQVNEERSSRPFGRSGYSVSNSCPRYSGRPGKMRAFSHFPGVSLSGLGLRRKSSDHRRDTRATRSTHAPAPCTYRSHASNAGQDSDALPAYRRARRTAIAPDRRSDSATHNTGTCIRTSATSSRRGAGLSKCKLQPCLIRSGVRGVTDQPRRRPETLHRDCSSRREAGTPAPGRPVCPLLRRPRSADGDRRHRGRHVLAVLDDPPSERTRPSSAAENSPASSATTDLSRSRTQSLENRRQAALTPEPMR